MWEFSVHQIIFGRLNEQKIQKVFVEFSTILIIFFHCCNSSEITTLDDF